MKKNLLKNLEDRQQGADINNTAPILLKKGEKHGTKKNVQQLCSWE